MAHLVTSLQAYIAFEVVEAAWIEFMEGLSTTNNLDSLIRKSSNFHTLPLKIKTSDPQSNVT